MLICSYPKLFAACHVLHRLLMPRHPPCALFRLTSLYDLHHSAVLKKELCKSSLQNFEIVIVTLHMHFHARVVPQSFFSLFCRFALSSLVQFSRCNRAFFRELTAALSEENDAVNHRCIRKMVGPSGLEPPTLRLSVVRSSQLSYGPISNFLNRRSGGGDKRDRTADPLLAKQVLSQLSYTPISSHRLCSSGGIPSKLNNVRNGQKRSDLGTLWVFLPHVSLERR